MVRPTSLLYLAVDGPAPRAKMNQQRSRRFKSAAEAVAREQLRREVEQEWRDVGKEPPPRADGGEGGGGGGGGEPLKDSNIITPGTPFMATLGRWLRHYAYARINGKRFGGGEGSGGGEGGGVEGEGGEAGEWTIGGGGGLTIVLSDASVPGEGEHKICAFIRSMRAAAAEAAVASRLPAGPAIHHAIHGSDADLIMPS